MYEDSCGLPHLADIWWYGLAPQTHPPAVNVITILSEGQPPNNNTLLTRNNWVGGTQQQQQQDGAAR